MRKSRLRVRLANEAGVSARGASTSVQTWAKMRSRRRKDRCKEDPLPALVACGRLLARMLTPVARKPAVQAPRLELRQVSPKHPVPGWDREREATSRAEDNQRSKRASIS